MKWRRLSVRAALIMALNGDKTHSWKSLKYREERENPSIMMITSRRVCKSGFATLAIMSHSDNSSVCLSPSGETVAVQDYCGADGEEAPDTDARTGLCHLHGRYPAIRLSSIQMQVILTTNKELECNIHHTGLCIPGFKRRRGGYFYLNII